MQGGATEATQASEAAITIVSGLPRSGTSLMMQMLEAGGLPTLTDDERAADADNPRGYHEYAPVKALRRDASWLARARGHALKVVAPLLDALPEGLEIRVVWMQRNLDEILASQRAMLARGGRVTSAGDEAELRRAFEHHLRRARRQLEERRVPVLPVEHADVLAEPADTARQLAAFLADAAGPAGFDADAAAAAVDAALHRHRS